MFVVFHLKKPVILKILEHLFQIDMEPFIEKSTEI